MSYSKMKIITAADGIKSVGEFGNSHGFAARIWRDLARCYLGDEIAWLRNSQAVWDLWMDWRLKESHQLVLLSTFDQAIVEFEQLPLMAAHYRDFVLDFPAGNRVDHLPAMAAQFEALHRDYPTGTVGVCFFPMSVADDLWRFYDADRKEARDYDLDRDKGHFFVFDTLATHLAVRAALDQAASQAVSDGAVDAGAAGDA